MPTQGEGARSGKASGERDIAEKNACVSLQYPAACAHRLGQANERVLIAAGDAKQIVERPKVLPRFLASTAWGVRIHSVCLVGSRLLPQPVVQERMHPLEAVTRRRVVVLHLVAFIELHGADARRVEHVQRAGIDVDLERLVGL